MKSVQTLPEGYREIFSINMQSNKKIALALNVAALCLGIIMAVCMHFYISIFTLFDMSKGLGTYTLRMIILLVSLIAYILLHELVHGMAMKFYGCQKVKYGFTGLYAYAGCDNYFYKKSYIVIALAPIVILGIIIAIINVFVPVDYFWVVYLIQICNISGAAGDIYVTVKFSKMPKDILVKDTGVHMVVYSDKQF